MRKDEAADISDNVAMLYDLEGVTLINVGVATWFIDRERFEEITKGYEEYVRMENQFDNALDVLSLSTQLALRFGNMVEFIGIRRSGDTPYYMITFRVVKTGEVREFSTLRLYREFETDVWNMMQNMSANR